jgi:RecB family exonuclease
VTRAEIRSQVRLRQSSIKDFMLCPKLFQYRHLDGVEAKTRSAKMLNGSALHLLLYWLHHGEWDMDVENMYPKAFAHYEYSSDESHIPVRFQKERETDLKAFTATAVEIVDGYRRRQENKESRMLYQEVEFRVKILGELFEGTIDGIRQLPDGKIELFDYKSNAIRPNVHAVAADIQLNLYSYSAMWGEFKVGDDWIKPRILPDYSSIYYLPNHRIRKRSSPNGQKGDEFGYPLIRTSKSIEDLRAFRKEVSNILKSMLKPWYYKNNSTACVFCQYTDLCQSQNPLVTDKAASKANEMLVELGMSN